jgi:hypothetical protein
MTSLCGNSWLDLFSRGSKQTAGSTLDFRILETSGEPLLALPAKNALAVKALALYPAQRLVARLAKSGLRAALAAGLPLPLQRVTVSVSGEDDFAKFLTGLAGDNTAVMPSMAVLMGNPRAAGRRFTILVFGQNTHPAAIVKAGTDEAAWQLIDKEERLLRAVGEQFVGAPRLRSSFCSDRIRAIALDFYEGRSPRPNDNHQLAAILDAWINRERWVRIGDTPTWNQIEQECAGVPLMPVLRGRIAQRSVHPTLYHGDFTPWNIKVSSRNGSWTVLDWERGQLTGLPGWDWFHYELQTAILVRKLRGSSLRKRVERLLCSEPFQRYARQAGISDIARDLLLGYVLYCVEVLRPSEGCEASEELLEMLSRA